MKMKNNLREYDDFDDYDDDHEMNKKQKKKTNRHDHQRRRPIRNWTKAFEEHLADHEEVDEFYGRA